MTTNNVLKNGNKNLTEIEGGFLVVGTSEIENWTDGKPFVISMETEEDFIENGFTNEEYADCKKMNVGEVKSGFDYEGIYVIRVK